MGNGGGLLELTSVSYYMQYTYVDSKIGMSQRNKDIVKEFICGKTIKELAEEYGVSYNRVKKILMEFKKRVKLVRTGNKTYVD